MISYLALSLQLLIAPQQKAQQKPIVRNKIVVVHHKRHTHAITCDALPILEQMKYCMSTQEVEDMFRIIEHYEKHNYPDMLKKPTQHGDSGR